MIFLFLAMSTTLEMRDEKQEYYIYKPWWFHIQMKYIVFQNTIKMWLSSFKESLHI